MDRTREAVSGQRARGVKETRETVQRSRTVNVGMALGVCVVAGPHLPVVDEVALYGVKNCVAYAALKFLLVADESIPGFGLPIWLAGQAKM